MDNQSLQAERDRLAEQVAQGERVIASLRRDLAMETITRKKVEAEFTRLRRPALRLCNGFDKHGAFYAHTPGFKASLALLRKAMGLDGEG